MALCWAVGPILVICKLFECIFFLMSRKLASSVYWGCNQSTQKYNFNQETLRGHTSVKTAEHKVLNFNNKTFKNLSKTDKSDNQVHFMQRLAKVRWGEKRGKDLHFFLHSSCYSFWCLTRLCDDRRFGSALLETAINTCAVRCGWMTPHSN